MKFARLAIACAGIATLGLTACSTPAADPAQPNPVTSNATAAQFPVTLDVPGTDEPLTVAEEPRNIVALSSDAAVALHELGLTERIVAVPEIVHNATLNSYAARMGGIPHRIAGETSPEPELVASWNPDLVIVTTRHTGEHDASSRLTDTGIPVLSLTNGWSTSEAIIENLELIGQATGTSARAAGLAAEIRAGLSEVRDRAAAAADVPSVAILSNQAHAPFINGTGSLVTELVENAGGANAAQTIGIDKTMPIQPEQLIAANPDYIMLVDVTGKGEDSFAGLLNNPAVAGLPAVAEGRVKTFAGREVYGLAGKAVVTGSASVLEWLHPELAG